MSFFSNLVGAIASFFGIGTPEVIALAPEPVAQEQSVAEVHASTSNNSNIDMSNHNNASHESNAETAVQSASAMSTDQSTDVAAATATNEDVSEANVTPDVQTMLVAGGCFWCVEADLEKTAGVIEAVSGYAGGTADNPTYENYGSGGHREVVEVTYDANKISYEDILIVTLKTTDPTDDDGTFNDRGNKYSSAFYFETAEQKAIIDKLISEVDEEGPYEKPLAIDVEKRPKFWPAEDYHQNYYKGTLSKLKYQYYRNASGRTDFIKKHWGEQYRTPGLPWRAHRQAEPAGAPAPTQAPTNQSYMWNNYTKPSKEELKKSLDPAVFTVTQEDGTERAGTSPLDRNYEPGIYVDVLSGEPLYSSRDKFDSGTGWPSFVKPITPKAITLHEDRKLFSVRTETRSAIADNHLGHVFNDGPADRGGLRYCMNGAALKFVPKAEMNARGYGDFLQYVE